MQILSFVKFLLNKNHPYTSGWSLVGASYRANKSASNLRGWVLLFYLKSRAILGLLTL